MTDQEYLIWLQSSIDYMFREYDLLQSALITPGFTGDKVGDWEEKKEYEGNRTLAHIGDSIVPLVIRHKILLVDGMSRAVASNKSTCITSRKHQEERANLLGITAHLKLNKRLNGKVNSTTLRLALCSIIGAVWQDCDHNFTIITKVVYRLLVDPLIVDESPTNVFSQDTVAIVPGFFDDCMYGYEIPNVDLANSSLEMLRADSIENHNDFQAEDVFLDTFISPEALDIIHQQQDASISSQIQEATAMNTAPCLYKTKFIPMPSSSSAHSLNTSQTKSISEAETASKISSKQRKRKSHMHSAIRRVSISDSLRDHMRLEKERCHNLGFHFASNDFDTAMKIASPGLKPGDLISHQLKMLYFTIGSGESLVSLRSLLKIRRRLIAGKQPAATKSLTIVERMEKVELLNTKIAYNVFERRYHIYHLYTESRALNHKTSDGFVNTTTQSILTHNASRMGNPLNLDENQVTQKMLHLLHPNLVPGSTEYKKKLRSIGRIRKLGERFEILVRKFGYGIIGLLPLPVDDLTTESAFHASDSLSDTLFLSFVECIVQLKGKFLKDISCAVDPIVTVLFEREMGPFRIFPLEQVETTQILRLSSGSQKLLDLISGQYDSNCSRSN
ncbi:hypothetical protein BOTCAL_0311g00060 [Botryotinia calthae]|uniref:RNase III domain-containing protein n=1 Tax=Botryotinia calthae TaxID=38488 RepID=A0A4Y8CU18_9HELO|nr:hypothetical protein BOTCAL_0311g00060 [Botryotinia calthae]